MADVDGTPCRDAAVIAIAQAPGLRPALPDADKRAIKP